MEDIYYGTTISKPTVNESPNGHRYAQFDEEGRLVFPADLHKTMGIQPGARVIVETDTNKVMLHRPVTHLAKVYIEPTNTCNLNCRTCMRNIWQIPLGMMNEETLNAIIKGLRSFEPTPTIFFGGLGEPLNHPNIVSIVARAKSLGGSVELITNGTLLTREMSASLIEAGLDMLWVSLDGATPESFSDVRLGAALPKILDNLSHFSQLVGRRSSSPQLGIAFVAMKRNLSDLPKVIRLGRRFRATRFSITNVLPYTYELQDEMLCRFATSFVLPKRPSSWFPRVKIPNIDLDQEVREILHQIYRGASQLEQNGTFFGDWNDRCPFIEAGVTAIDWEGNVSPCLPLMHDHSSYVNDFERFSRRYVVGNVMECTLLEIWNDPDYLAFRERVQDFDFAPCTL
ncbi:MAG: radical SAM protein, partial [Anaerolineales bacterium]|nr:radical SAM protein [Anaerolineales bacterium]